MPHHFYPRRSFIYKGLRTLALLPFAAGMALEALESKKTFSGTRRNRSLKILILGGTSFLGPHQVAYALSRGHSITTFTRGKTKPTIHPELFGEVEQLVGDREDNLEALKGRKWDVVIDNSGRKVKWTQETATLLKDQVDHYMYVSSVSVYYPFHRKTLLETDELILEVPEGLDENEKRTFEFGVMKANSELAAINTFGSDRTTVVRPTFIMGPGDRGDRFMYWPIQLAKGGDVIIPGNQDERVQFIDVRDLAGWMIRLCEDKVSGIYNGSGPASEMSLPAFVYGAHAAFNTKVNFIHIDDYEFLENNNIGFIGPWVKPSDKSIGIAGADNYRALESGITYLPLTTTIKDTYDWWYSDAVTEERRNKYALNENGLHNRQAELIKKWNADKK